MQSLNQTTGTNQTVNLSLVLQPTLWVSQSPTERLQEVDLRAFSSGRLDLPQCWMSQSR